MTSAASPRLPVVPARIRSAAFSSSSPRRPSFRCISATNVNSASLSSASLHMTDGTVGSADLSGLQAPPVTVPSNRDSYGMPRPLTSAELIEMSEDGLKVAYQGFPGAYSEAAAKKAYPNCHTVPCEHFETAFQAVENWVVVSKSLTKLLKKGKQIVWTAETEASFESLKNALITAQVQSFSKKVTPFHS